MNLLLLLSALLSALSGMGQAVRGGRTPQAVCAATADTAAAMAVRRGPVIKRPQQVLPRAAEAPVTRIVALWLVPSEPLFAGRRRE